MGGAIRSLVASVMASSAFWTELFVTESQVIVATFSTLAGEAAAPDWAATAVAARNGNATSASVRAATGRIRRICIVVGLPEVRAGDRPTRSSGRNRPGQGSGFRNETGGAQQHFRHK